MPAQLYFGRTVINGNTYAHVAIMIHRNQRYYIASRSYYILLFCRNAAWFHTHTHTHACRDKEHRPVDSWYSALTVRLWDRHRFCADFASLHKIRQSGLYELLIAVICSLKYRSGPEHGNGAWFSATFQQLGDVSNLLLDTWTAQVSAVRSHLLLQLHRTCFWVTSWRGIVFELSL